MERITVILTDREYKTLHRKACLISSGFIMSALRLKAGLPELPTGYRKWETEQAEQAKIERNRDVGGYR